MSNLMYNNDKKCLNCKTAEYLITDTRHASLVCTKCGTVCESRMIYDGQDWNNYEEGVNNSRVGAVDEINPYATCGTYIKPGTFITVIRNGKTVKVDLAKLHTRISYTSKQKSYDSVANIFKDLENEGMSNIISVTAQRYWAAIMDNGTHRGAVRKGIIASCILYACYENGMTMSRQDVANKLRIKKEYITKGENIFRDMVKGTKIEHILKLSSNTLQMFQTKMGLFKHYPSVKFQHTKLCTALYVRFEKKFADMKSTTVVGGIITYILKDQEKIKSPNKGEICDIIGITSPTITKMVKFIKKCIEEEKETFQTEIKETVTKTKSNKKKIIPTEKHVIC